MLTHQTAAQHPINVTDVAESYIAKHPGDCLACAIFLGVVLGWWIKRK
jgi:ElaB/YqjD/DUF883 family membrane-anchored ribosome-binding protein